MSKKSDITRAQLQRLAQYWFRAEIMRQHLHVLREELGPDLQLLDPGNFWEFDTYLQYWLSALFVVVEAFNKLGIKNTIVRRLLNENIQTLKQNRHNTFHFTFSDELPSGAPPLLLDDSQLNWAEELHEAMRTHIAEIANARANGAPSLNSDLAINLSRLRKRDPGQDKG